MRIKEQNRISSSRLHSIVWLSLRQLKVSQSSEISMEFYSIINTPSSLREIKQSSSGEIKPGDNKRTQSKLGQAFRACWPASPCEEVPSDSDSSSLKARRIPVDNFIDVRPMHTVSSRSISAEASPSQMQRDGRTVVSIFDDRNVIGFLSKQ